MRKLWKRFKALFVCKNKLRVWILGSLEHKMIPTQEVYERLKNIIQEIRKNEVTDVIWGPDLQVFQLENCGPNDITTDVIVTMINENKMFKQQVM